jgi:hypothetical protein
MKSQSHTTFSSHVDRTIGVDSGWMSQAWPGSRSQHLSSWRGSGKSTTAEESVNPISSLDLLQPRGVFDWRDSRKD